MGPGCFYPGNNPGPANGHRVSDASMGPGCFYPGNLVDQDRVGVAPVASMGPGCFYPGNVCRAASQLALIVLQWGRDVSIPEMGPPGTDRSRPSASMGPGCFYPGNAARKADCGSAGMLQWGRDVSIPEMDSAATRHRTAHLLQWGRDVSIPEIMIELYAHAIRLCFNGAGMFLSRKFVHVVLLDFQGFASMGPGCFYPGNP